jgi:hypothetical protein
VYHVSCIIGKHSGGAANTVMAQQAANTVVAQQAANTVMAQQAANTVVAQQAANTVMAQQTQVVHRHTGKQSAESFVV